MLGTDAAIDLGTSRTRIYLPQQGVVIDEPSVVAVDNMTEEIIAIGRRPMNGGTYLSEADG